jgi:signal transduction histidine kinase
VQVNLDVDGARQDLGAATEVVVLHVVSESLANVVRHASAERVDVRVSVTDRVVWVDVADDGDGPARPVRAGVGLESMRERVAELEGNLRLSRGPLGGFRVSASIPLEDT